MIWHILRKDWRLLWPMVAALALLNALRMVVSAMGIGQFHHPTPAVPLSGILTMICLIATALLVVLVVQNDAIPGLRQDWLVRPVRRTDLLLSKLAFVVLLIQCPVFIADVINGLTAGLPPGSVLSASLVQSLQSLLVFVLPLLAFATLTRNLMEALAGGLAVALCVVLFMTSVLGHTPVIDSGIAWIAGLVQSLWVLAGAAVILGIQYYRRRTIPSRWICGATLIAALMAELMPWDSAFAIQERLSSQPAAGSKVQIDFGKSPRANVVNSNFPGTVLWLPMTIRGVGSDERLAGARDVARIVEPDGKTTELEQRFNYRPFSDERREQQLMVTRELYVRLKRESVRLELDYWLTLLRVSATQSLPMDSAQLTDGTGKCVTRTDFVASQIEWSCRIAGRPPCTRLSVEGLYSLTVHSGEPCFADYSPWLGRLGGEAVTSFHNTIPFQTPETTQEKLRNARLEMRVYQPVAHFTRHVVVPDFRVDDAGSK